ncbi:hypothetical protein FOI68_16920 [Brevibacillus sp. LEMMJ03]|uniref:hypothetical protein n=1 Tax=Brevibacillus sp. LEMMJ03 TaxID=2595056 RepID=UPI00118131A3|nr:hypothetical protein [Brevibacillus sp. LEMMJ03]TRY24335.1 hypothetical protein FOI68_16920 [Brevibacillus sp. LEMMJ03]
MIEIITLILVLCGFALYFAFFRRNVYFFGELVIYSIVLVFVASIAAPIVNDTFTSKAKGTVTSAQWGTATVTVKDVTGFMGDKVYEVDASDFPLLKEGDEVTLNIEREGILKRINSMLQNPSEYSDSIQNVKIESHNVTIFTKAYRYLTMPNPI